MNKEEIKKILPHREPMLLVDEVELIDGVAHGKCHIKIGRASCRERV